MKRYCLPAGLVLAIIASCAAVPGWADQAYELAWVRQLGTTAADKAYSVTVDPSGNAYICGRTEGSLGGPYEGPWCDGFLAKYDSAGHLLWTRQMGTVTGDESWSVAADPSGNIYVGGYTFGSLAGPQVGGGDAFLIKYNTSGDVLWKRQIGTPTEEWTYSVDVDGYGNAYITGHTFGNLGGPNAGIDYAFLVKYNPVFTLVGVRFLPVGFVILLGALLLLSLGLRRGTAALGAR